MYKINGLLLSTSTEEIVRNYILLVWPILCYACVYLSKINKHEIENIHRV